MKIKYSFSYISIFIADCLTLTSPEIQLDLAGLL
jgi:hypothetical protein